MTGGKKLNVEEATKGQREGRENTEGLQEGKGERKGKGMKGETKN